MSLYKCLSWILIIRLKKGTYFRIRDVSIHDEKEKRIQQLHKKYCVIE